MNDPGQFGFSRRSLLRLAAALPVAGGAALLKASEPDIKVPSFNNLTDQEEIAFGQKIAAEMDAALPLLHVGLLEEYVNDMVGKLGRASKRPNMDFKAKVINTMDVNAYSILGGHMYVYRGLLHYVNNEAELAAVLAHEVGHVVGHHSANKVMLQVKAKQLYEAVKNNVLLQNQVIRQVIQKLGGPLALLALLKYERDQEFEADLFGFYEAFRCKWDPNGFVSFFERIRQATGDPDLMKSLKSDHPPAGERAARIRQEMTTVSMPGKMTTESLRFKAMKLSLNALPPPVKKHG
jgi:beta-barrel assembly-enhancing protease